MQLTEVQQITGGEIFAGTAEVTSVSIDTRTLQPGALFIAIKGPNFNGNQFIEAAGRQHANAAVIDELEVADAQRSEHVLPLLKVVDTRRALGELGAWNRSQSNATVIALTGSQGKTTVKEMLSAILSECGKVLATRGNLNNDLGVPLTLLNIEAGHEYAVIEMGANGANEIAYTTNLTKPLIAHITNVAPTHLEGFGSLAGVAKAKAEIWQGLSKGGTAVLNRDDPNIVDFFEQSINVQDINCVSISANGNPQASYRITKWASKGLAGSRFTIVTPVGEVEINLSIPGKHNAANALAAAALSMEAGASAEHVMHGLGNMHAVPGRLAKKSGMSGATILDDSYNASPASFRAAIDVLAEQPGKRIVVAGDMGELGKEQVQEHGELGRYAKEKGIEYFFGVGPLMEEAVQGFGAGGQHFASQESLVATLREMLTTTTCILVKGSRSANMDKVVKLIIEEEN